VTQKNKFSLHTLLTIKAVKGACNINATNETTIKQYANTN